MKRKVLEPITVLRSVRIERDMRQHEVATILGVSVEAICQWETGARRPSLFNFCCWAESLGVEVVVKEKNNALD